MGLTMMNLTFLRMITTFITRRDIFREARRFDEVMSNCSMGVNPF